MDSVVFSCIQLFSQLDKIGSNLEIYWGEICNWKKQNPNNSNSLKLNQLSPTEFPIGLSWSKMLFQLEIQYSNINKLTPTQSNSFQLDFQLEWVGNFGKGSRRVQCTCTCTFVSWRGIRPNTPISPYALYIHLYIHIFVYILCKLLFILLVLSVLIYLFYLIYFYSFLRCLFGTLDCLFFYVNLCKFCKFNVILPLATKLNVFNKPWRIIIIIIHRLYNVQPKQRRTCTFSGDRSSHHGD